MAVFIETAAAARGESGAYALLVALDAPLAVRAGARVATLEPARYIYCGSARGPGGLAARLARHIRREKRAHWHVDQLTGAGRVLGAWVFPGQSECAVNDALADFPIPLEGFGSSDCKRCRSHLRLWPAGAPAPFE
ncbi:MAG TPA: GIY-YIG nuclease family protein [Methylocystis sp.]|nr:GIY-YIG nuclease family protein [Methylocystis sp.]